MPDHAEQLDRLKAALADRYTIDRELGEGGMATVYLAEDIKHDRKVAIKVLKPELAAVLGAERFVQEIKTTANLQHPHILPLFDSGEADGFLYYVMPYVEGETLRDKLNRETQLGIEEAVRITTEVADALDYAHRQNVIHRDIKPENILLHDGRPMVADFGIALAVSAAAGGRMTETGLSLGTPHYMSPEQATAEKDLTNRSDIYSLGAVLYEMLTGSPPHVGSSAQQIIMKIVTEEVAPVTRVRKAVPPNVAAAVAVALEKLPADRFVTATAFATALSDPTFTTEIGGAREHKTGTAPWKTIALATTALAVAAVLWGIVTGREASSAESTETARRFSVLLPDSAPMAVGTGRPAVTLTPDGTRIVYVSRIHGETVVLQHDLSSDSVGLVPGSVGGTGPFVKPSGDAVGFFVWDELIEASLMTGASVEFNNMTPVTRGATWLNDSVVAVNVSPNDGLARVILNAPLDRDSLGRAATLIPIRRAEGERSVVWPVVVPRREALLYVSDRGGGPDKWQIGVRTLDATFDRVLIQGGSHPQYAASGHLVFVRSGALWAVPFDRDRLELRGPEVQVLMGVLTEPSGIAHYAIADDGTLVYASGGGWRSERRLVWISTSGAVEPLPFPVRNYAHPDLAPDDLRVVATLYDGSNFDVWLGDVARGTWLPLTHDAGEDLWPLWAPEGARVALATEVRAGGPPQVGIVDLRTGDLEVVGDPGWLSSPGGWVGDGSELYYDADSLGAGRSTNGYDIKVLDVATGSLSTWLATTDDEWQAHPSPDGRWVAYVSDQSGRDEVYVRAAEGTDIAQPVSTGGGVEPLWNRSGDALYFRRGDQIFRVAATPASGGQLTLSAPEPRFVFPPMILTDAGWDITADERRVLAVSESAQLRVSSLRVVVDWFSELKAKVGN